MECVVPVDENGSEVAARKVGLGVAIRYVVVWNRRQAVKSASGERRTRLL